MGRQQPRLATRAAKPRPRDHSVRCGYKLISPNYKVISAYMVIAQELAGATSHGSQSRQPAMAASHGSQSRQPANHAHGCRHGWERATVARAVTNQTFCPSTERSSHLRDRAENRRKPRRSLGAGKQSISSVPVSFALASQGNISCSVSPNENCALAFPSRPSRLLAFLQIPSRSKRRGHRDGTLATAMRAAFWQPREMR